MNDFEIPILRTRTKMMTVSERIEDAYGAAQAALHNEKITRTRLDELEKRIAALEAAKTPEGV